MAAQKWLFPHNIINADIKNGFSEKEKPFFFVRDHISGKKTCRSLMKIISNK